MDSAIHLWNNRVTVASLIHIQEQMAEKNEISIPEIFRKMFVGLSSFFSVFVSFTKSQIFFLGGGICKRNSAKARRFPGVTPAEMAASKCIKLQERSDILRLLRFQPSRFSVLPPASLIFYRFSHKKLQCKTLRITLSYPIMSHPVSPLDIASKF